jgi:hypothetical protein
MLRQVIKVHNGRIYEQLYDEEGSLLYDSTYENEAYA